MNVRIAWLSLAFAATAASLPASAADFGGNPGTLKDLGATPGVPVPAPVPIPEYRPSWYFRIDAGIGTIGDPSVSGSGFIYGDDASEGGPGPITGPGDAMTTSSSWFDNDFNTFATFGGGVGYYFGGGFRMDATIEARSKDDIHMNGETTWDTHSYYQDCCGNDVYGTDPNGNGLVDSRSRMTVDDKVDVDGTIWMMNAYYDLGKVRGFTPYVGAGVGFIWNRIHRAHSSTLATCDNEAAPPNNCALGEWTDVTTTEEGGTTDSVTIAAAAMAGFSYDLTDMTALDIGYRYLHLGGTSATMNIGGDDSRIKIGDQNIHQFRAGFRINVD